MSHEGIFGLSSNSHGAVQGSSGTHKRLPLWSVKRNAMLLLPRIAAISSAWILTILFFLSLSGFHSAHGDSITGDTRQRDSSAGADNKGQKRLRAVEAAIITTPNRGVTDPSATPAKADRRRSLLASVQIPSTLFSNANNGRSSRGNQGRVVDGTDADPSAYPFILAFTNERGEQWCSGALIHESLVLTAAHCVSRIVYAHTHVHNIQHDTSNPDTNYTVAQKIVHPWYTLTDSMILHDIALLRLAEPVTTVTPVAYVEKRQTGASAISSFGQPPQPAINSDVTVAGWGRLCDFEAQCESPSVLQETTVPVIDGAAVCKPTYGQTYENDNMFCTLDDVGSTGFCSGDSGSPALSRTGSNEWTVTGVVSYTSGASCVDYPNVFTRVQAYSTWIDEVIAALDANSGKDDGVLIDIAVPPANSGGTPINGDSSNSNNNSCRSRLLFAGCK